MRAMRLYQLGAPLQLEDVPIPAPGPHVVLLRVSACGVCRTDLHILDGELPPHKVPVVPGHQIVGRVVETGADVHDLEIGTRVGVPWLGHTCGACPYCRAGKENLCDHAAFTGYDVDGGYADYARARREACIPLPEGLDDSHIAPLLCGGLIGYRAYRFAQPAKRLGLFGFGAAAHVLAQIAADDGVEVYAVTRPGDVKAQALARELGAAWAGEAARIPQLLDSIIIFAADGGLVPAALRVVRKGGRVVCAGIHMSAIPSFPYDLIWGERSLQSVANLCRSDGTEFFDRIAHLPIKTSVTSYPLARANVALSDLRAGRITGAAVLDCR